MSDHRALLEEYRGLRDELEALVLPMATPVDGYRFEYQASLHGLELEGALSGKTTSHPALIRFAAGFGNYGSS